MKKPEDKWQHTVAEVVQDQLDAQYHANLTEDEARVAHKQLVSPASRQELLVFTQRWVEDAFHAVNAPWAARWKWENYGYGPANLVAGVWLVDRVPRRGVWTREVWWELTLTNRFPALSVEWTRPGLRHLAWNLGWRDTSFEPQRGPFMIAEMDELGVLAIRETRPTWREELPAILQHRAHHNGWL